MATLSKPVGYECEFVDQVPEDYLCELCQHVAREPNITSCCGECFCKTCIDAVIQDKKPCPSCQETEFIYFMHKKYQPKILALKIHCLMKNRGCEWTGQLQHLDAHLDVTTGDCVYVDVDCPSDCNQRVQKRNVNTHFDEECPNRDYICPHCSFRATFREVSKHFEVCRYYPLVCPNRCGATFERDEHEDHMKMCSLQKVQCEFSYVGCQADFIRNKQKEHMEQNTQKHLTLMAAATLKISQEQQQRFDQKFQQKDAEMKALQDQQRKKLDEQQEAFHKKLGENAQQIKTLEETFEQKLHEKDAQMKALEDQQQKKLGEQQEEFLKQLKENAQRMKTLEETFEEKLQEKDAHIKALEEVFEKKLCEQEKRLQKQQDERIRELEKQSLQVLPIINQMKSHPQADTSIPPHDITFTGYQVVKARGRPFQSSHLFTHPGGYKFVLKLRPNGMGVGTGTHMSVLFLPLKGDYDDKLKFPAKFTITVELVNQHRDQDHYTRDIVCEVTRELIGAGFSLGTDWKFIPHADLEWNADKQTQYLKNNCLKCRITKIVIQ